MNQKIQSFRGIENSTLHGFRQAFFKRLMDMNPMLRKFMGG